MSKYAAPHRVSRKRRLSHRATILVAAGLLVSFSLLAIAKTPVRAAAANPIYATIHYVDTAISTALAPIQSAIAGLQSTQATHTQQISDLQNTSNKALHVYDAKGHELGLLVNHNNPDLANPPTNTIYSTALQRFIYIWEINAGAYVNGFSVLYDAYFQSPDCTGTAYNLRTGYGHEYIASDVLPFSPTVNYTFNDSETPSTVNLGSHGYWDTSSNPNQLHCDPYTSTGTTAYELHPVSLPFPTPIAFPLQFKYQ